MSRQSFKAVLCSGVIAALAVAGQTSVRAKERPSARMPDHVVMTSQQDRQRVIDQLKITLFPSGPGAYLASTYDENTANPYPNLPDPLTFNDGSKVKTAAQWHKRRAEILEFFDREVYGRRPKNSPKVTWSVVNTTDGTTGNVPVITKQLI